MIQGRNSFNNPNQNNGDSQKPSFLYFSVLFILKVLSTKEC